MSKREIHPLGGGEIKRVTPSAMASPTSSEIAMMKIRRPNVRDIDSQTPKNGSQNLCREFSRMGF
jgi:hypothetical protein